VRARLLDELRSLPAPLDPQAVMRLPYLDAVCSETLRLNPVAPIVGRTLRRGLTLQGYELPPEISVGIGIVNVHRRADLYPEPEQFRPERFLSREYGPFEYLPFGGGSRRCLGAAFAVYEMKLVLATVLRSHGLRLIRDVPVRAALRNTTVGPAVTIEMARG
jgi:cytochrome P450